MPTPSLRASRAAALSRLGIWAAALVGSAAASAAVCRVVLLTVAVALGGCAVLPSHVARPSSFARRDVDDTPLARIAAASTPEDQRELSGFRLLPEGAEAFAARIALIRRAEKTIDVQYYVIASDRTGREFLRELRAAAARGVRVRILVDDLYATGEDELFASLAANDNVEVRMFNPLPVRSGSFGQRILLSLHQFSRINHRMHNKLFIADGSFAVTGGRNIADAYFDRGGDANFIDMDVLSTGPVVARLGAVFDRFWNADIVYPVQSLVGGEPLPQAFEQQLRPAEIAAASTPDPESVEAGLANGRLAFERAEAEVFADAPQKASGDTDEATVAEAHLDLLGSAQSSVRLASPYFVPGPREMQALATIRSHDVGVSVLTNSLATTDEPLVHYGYARHRAALLDAGVELHELRPSAEAGAEATRSIGSSGGSSGAGRSLGRLHTKLSVIDDEKTFVGSMNMDARSAHLNTETGMVIHSRTLAALVTRFLRGHEKERSYQVRLEGDQLRWSSGEGSDRQTRSAEPRAASAPALPVRVLAQLLGEGLL